MGRNGRLHSKRAVVTGASSGIGRAIALAFAAEGATVVITYRRSVDRAAAVLAELREYGGGHAMLRLDLGEAATIADVVGAAERQLGGLDVWANIAGADILTGEGASLSDFEKLDRLLDIDLRGTILCSWAAVERMKEHGGAIINMSWDLALFGMGGRNPEMFAAAKAGISGFSKSLARSCAPGVRVNELAPGWIETAFAETEMDPEAYRRVVQQTPLERFGTPEDVAQAAVYLASDEARFITGQTLRVNGGLI